MKERIQPTPLSAIPKMATTTLVRTSPKEKPVQKFTSEQIKRLQQLQNDKKDEAKPHQLMFA